MSKRTTFCVLAVSIGAGAVILFLRLRELRTAANANRCIDNLRLIESVKQQWALEAQKDSNAIPTVHDILLYPYFGFPPKMPRCPDGGTYIIGRLGELPKCSIPLHNVDLGSVSFGCEDAEGHVVHIKAKLAFDIISYDPIVGARVVIIDDSGRHDKALSNDNGWAEVRTWPHRPVAVIISKKGYATFSNTYTAAIKLADYGRIRLQKQPK